MQKVIRNKNDSTMIVFWCKGCNMAHSIKESPTQWTFNGNEESPSISPSIMNRLDQGPMFVPEQCHLFINDGSIRYLDDCTHELKGKTITMDEVPEWLK